MTEEDGILLIRILDAHPSLAIIIGLLITGCVLWFLWQFTNVYVAMRELPELKRTSDNLEANFKETQNDLMEIKNQLIEIKEAQVTNQEKRLGQVLELIEVVYQTKSELIELKKEK